MGIWRRDRAVKSSAPETTGLERLQKRSSIKGEVITRHTKAPDDTLTTASARINRYLK
jgi:hypothetical protein